MTWAQFERAAPELARRGADAIEAARGGAFLATVDGDALPRIHPITVAIVDGRLCAFILGSGKRRALERDGRFALHAWIDPVVPVEFAVRGRAHAVDDPATRAAVAAGWKFEPDDTYVLFEFSIEHALLGVRNSADEWPPRYQTWSAG